VDFKAEDQEEEVEDAATEIDQLGVMEADVDVEFLEGEEGLVASTNRVQEYFCNRYLHYHYLQRFNKAKNTRKPTKKVDEETLDMEMASYWDKSGNAE